MNTTETKDKVPAPSRKARVKIAFAQQGQETAWVLGQKLKLAQSTLRTWFATWRREGLQAQAETAKKPTPKGKVAKPAPKAKVETKKNGNGNGQTPAAVTA